MQLTNTCLILSCAQPIPTLIWTMRKLHRHRRERSLVRGSAVRCATGWPSLLKATDGAATEEMYRHYDAAVLAMQEKSDGVA